MKLTHVNNLYDAVVEDENKGKCTLKKLSWETCDGECKSISWYEQAPFKLKKPVLPPFMFDSTFNCLKVYESNILGIKQKNNWEVILETDALFRNGDITVIGDSNDCWVVKPIRRTPKGFEHLARKFNTQRVNKVDIKILSEAKTIKLKK